MFFRHNIAIFLKKKKKKREGDQIKAYTGVRKYISAIFSAVKHLWLRRWFSECLSKSVSNWICPRLSVLQHLLSLRLPLFSDIIGAAEERKAQKLIFSSLIRHEIIPHLHFCCRWRMHSFLERVCVCACVHDILYVLWLDLLQSCLEQQGTLRVAHLIIFD